MCKYVWPVFVTATTFTQDGKRHRIQRTVEGGGNAAKALRDAVLAQKHPEIWIGCEIVGVTLLGQRIKVTYLG